MPGRPLDLHDQDMAVTQENAEYLAWQIYDLKCQIQSSVPILRVIQETAKVVAPYGPPSVSEALCLKKQSHRAFAIIQQHFLFLLDLRQYTYGREIDMSASGHT